MLLTLRVPIADLRGLAHDETVARSVVLPGAWATGSFVRGFGPITARPKPPAEPWLYEEAYADLGRTLTFEQRDLEAMSDMSPEYSVQKIRKRAWMALPCSTAMIDVDVALQLGPRHGSADRRRETGTFSVSDLKRVVQAAASLSVRVGPVSAGSSATLLRAGKALAERYDSHTSTGPSAHRLVRAGRSVAVLEAPGLKPENVTGRADRFGVSMTSFTLPITGGGQLRTHVIWDADGTAENRKRIREARIHILRLQSVREFLRFLATSSRDENVLARDPSDGGYEALQRALLSCVRIADRNAKVGHVDPAAILNATFPHERIFDDDLEILLKRTLGNMRPKVPAEAQAFISGERKRVFEPDAVATTRESIVNNYEVKANYVGVIGDNSTIENLVVGVKGRTISIGGHPVAIDALLKELHTLRDVAANETSDESQARVREIENVERAVESGDNTGALKSLRRLGGWALTSTNALGLAVAASAVSHALGMS